MRDSTLMLLVRSGIIGCCATLAWADDVPERTSESEIGLPNPLVEIRFAPGSALVERDALDEIAATVQWLRDHPDRLVFVEGHSDRSGNRAANLDLSYRRAEVVRDQLVRMGADPVRLVQAAYGETLASDDDAASRRVVLRGSVHGFPELISSQRPTDTRRGPEEPRRN